ncbi:hypothetical protein [Microbacterium sp. W4I20]|jgi:hypothetical protein|uniref:hypothetical protein n=1 Tax=Microbacterium sp. W4I20 TaxID=3042262 RepID=UPI0027813A2D|nr:hypothetical protein [Microbacterium sp. W4I20]MDQ0728436.1 hypothetical protein [Microbacterium sp. W4I20]
MTTAALTPTGRKTHRYLRLSLVFVVFTLLASVAVQSFVVSWEPFTVGWQVLPSISHYFYTPVRSIFTGALIAASLALLALSGRGPAPTLLDIAALFAPLIAIIPTGINAERPIGDLTCPGTDDCVPGQYLEDARLGVAVYVIVVIVVVLTMMWIRKHQGITTPSALLVSSIAVVTAAVFAVFTFVPGLNDAFPLNFWPLPQSLHFLATLLFFGTFAAVPILHARGVADPTEKTPELWQKVFYRWVAGLMIADLVMLVAAFVLRNSLGGFPLVLIGEALALALFAAFWWVQTFQRWNDENPAGVTTVD